MSRASLSYAAAQLSLLLLPLAISPSALKNTLLFSHAPKAKINHFLFTTQTDSMSYASLEAWLASFDLCSQY